MSVSEPNFSSDLTAVLPVLTAETAASTSVEAATGDKRPSGWRDLLGVTASIACAIHCAAMPFVIGFLPALGLSFLADEAFHQWMAGACFLIGLAAFLPGWRQHGRLLPAGIAATGLTVVTFAAFGLSGECCPECEAAAAVAATDEESVSCCDEECEHCAAAAAEAAEANATQDTDACCSTDSDGLAMAEETTAVQAGFITANAAWWTPLGGMLMVIGHLLNRRSLSRCACCGTDDKCSAESSNMVSNSTN